jgi:hypothetical protein
MLGGGKLSEWEEEQLVKISTDNRGCRWFNQRELV